MTNSLLSSSSVPVQLSDPKCTPALHVPKLETTTKRGVLVKEILCNCFAFDKIFLSCLSDTRYKTRCCVMYFGARSSSRILTNRDVGNQKGVGRGLYLC